MTTNTSNFIGAGLARQIKSGKTTTFTTRPPPEAMQAAALSLNLSEEHPATAQLQVKEPAAPVAASAVLSAGRFAKYAPPSKERESNTPTPVESQFTRASTHTVTHEEVSDAELEVPIKYIPEPIVAVTIEKGRFASAPSQQSKERDAKIHMSAIKALTPLVAAISFKPGSSADGAAMSAALAEMVCKVQQSTTDVAMCMGPYMANSNWARGQIMTSMAAIAANQWEKYGEINIENVGRVIAGVFREPSNELQSILDTLEGSDEYRSLEKDPDAARARLSVTISGASWDLYEWVTHETLQIAHPANSKQGMPSRVYSYGISVADVVETLLAKILDESRSFELTIENADLKLAQLQGTIRRLSQIAGAEYVTQTSAIHQWVEASPNEDERAKREALATEQFQTHVIPRVMSWTQSNFAAVENAASKMLREFHYEKESSTHEKNNR